MDIFGPGLLNEAIPVLQGAGHFFKSSTIAKNLLSSENEKEIAHPMRKPPATSRQCIYSEFRIHPYYSQSFDDKQISPI